MLRILVVEDDHRISDLLRRSLQEEGFQTLIAFDAETGLALCQQCDLVISDVMLPATNGIEFCRQIRKNYPTLPVLLLTALSSTDDKVQGFDAGADDYLIKPFEMRELLVRVKSLLKRSRLSASNAEVGLLKCADLQLNTQTKTVQRAGTDIKLTPKEFNLLEYMLLNQGRILSRSEIAEKVWNTHFDTGTNFIDVYINYLRRKIDKPFGQALIHTRPGMGFILTSHI